MDNPRNSPRISKPRPNRNKTGGKRMIGFYATPEQYEGLVQAAEAREITVAELLRRISKGTIRLED